MSSSSSVSSSSAAPSSSDPPLPLRRPEEKKVSLLEGKHVGDKRQQPEDIEDGELTESDEEQEQEEPSKKRARRMLAEAMSGENPKLRNCLCNEPVYTDKKWFAEAKSWTRQLDTLPRLGYPCEGPDCENIYCALCVNLRLRNCIKCRMNLCQDSCWEGHCDEHKEALGKRLEESDYFHP